MLLLQQQRCRFRLLFVIVRRMAKFVAGSLDLIPVFSFSSFKRDLFIVCTPWQYYRICGLDLPTSCHYGHARSQGGRQLAAAKPPLYTVFDCTPTCSVTMLVASRSNRSKYCSASERHCWGGFVLCALWGALVVLGRTASIRKEHPWKNWVWNYAVVLILALQVKEEHYVRIVE